MAPMNSVVDNLADMINQDIRRVVGNRRHPIVIREHSWHTETLLSRLPEENKRKVNYPSRQPPRVQEDELDISNLEGARELLRIYQVATHQPIEGVCDSRVTKLRLSLGFYMCAIAGVRRDDDTTHPRAESDNVQWASFRTELHELAEGAEFDRARKVNFAAITRALRDRVLELADVVVCTLSNAVDVSFLTSGPTSSSTRNQAGRPRLTRSAR